MSGMRVGECWTRAVAKKILREHFGMDVAVGFKASSGWLTVFARELLRVRGCNVSVDFMPDFVSDASLSWRLGKAPLVMVGGSTLRCTTWIRYRRNLPMDRRPPSNRKARIECTSYTEQAGIQEQN